MLLIEKIKNRIENSPISKMKFKMKNFLNSEEILKIENYSNKFQPITDKEKMYYFIHQVQEIPKCSICKINNVPITYDGFKEVCSNKCSLIRNGINKRVEKEARICHECNNEYFVKPYRPEKFCSASCATKYNQRNMSPESYKQKHEKREKTCLERYGSTSTIQSQHAKDLMKERYGTEIPLQNSELLQKMKATNLEKYGVESALNKPGSFEKMKATNLSKYGFEYSWQRDDVYDKIQSSRFKLKEFVFPSGRIEMVQGYETFGLQYLLNEGINESKIIVKRSEITSIAGSIMFDSTNENITQKRRYFPDFYLIEEKTFIEIKSDYHYTRDFDEINAKIKGCNDHGFKIRLIVFKQRGKSILIDQTF